MRSARTHGFCILFLSTLLAAQAPIPTIEQPLAPTTAQPGGAAFTLTINGAGFVPTPSAVIWRAGTSPAVQLPITISTATQVMATVPADDIAAAATSFVSVLNANGNPSNVEFFQIAIPASPQFLPPVDYSPSLNTVQTVLVGDFNGDGVLDSAVGVFDDPSQVCVLLGNSNGTFQAATCYPVNDATSIVAGRFRNDGGSIDLVAGDTLLTGNGDGTFTSVNLGTSGFRPYAVGDFRQTGLLDVVGILNGPSVVVQVLNNNGAGGFTAGQSFSGGVAQAGGMLTADFNGDGSPDLAVLDTGSSSIRVFLGSAAGFSGGNPIVTNTPAAVVAFTAADFNGDKKQDLALVYNTTGGQVLILNGNGDGTFTSGSTTLLANIVSGSIVTGDFNEDGKLDLATGTFILPGNGDGTFQTPINFGGANQVLATGDFNGDGRPDLIGQASPNIAVLLQQTPALPGAMLSPAPLNFTPNKPQLVGTSASQPVTLTNNGTAPLTIASIVLAGTNASEFTQTNNCPSTLGAGANCTINITFTPTANSGGGSASASLSVTDSAASSPQTVPISGSVQNFSLTTTCASLTVVPGQTAIFTVDLAPVNGFTQSVALSCSGTPPLASCTASPASPTLNGTSAVQAQVTVTTTRATGSLHLPLGRSNGYQLAALSGIAGFAALVMLPGKRRSKPARRIRAQIFLWCIVAAIATLPSCSGGSAIDPPGTATGTYPLTVTGTFQSAGGATATESVSFNLVVQ